MAGEREDPATQPGGRRPAPDGLGLVQEFVNTHFALGRDRGAERLSSPAALASWLYSHGLIERSVELGAEDLQRALALREGLRALGHANNGGDLGGAQLDALDEASVGAVVEVRLATDGPRFVASEGARLDAALGLVLAHTARAMLDGSWRRMKACPGQHCGWLFCDQSRNLTGRWCSMSVCGGRAKARAYYRRRTASGP